MVEPRQTLSTVELPTKKGASVYFWQGDEQYMIYADQAYAWTLAQQQSWRKKFIPLISIIEKDGGYCEVDQMTGIGNPVDDWRQIVRHYV